MFLSLMIYLGVEEYLQVVFQLRFKALKGQPDKKKLALTKKIQLAGLIVSVSAYPGNQLFFAFVSYFGFIIMVSAFMHSFSKFDFKDYFEALSTVSIFLLCLVWVFIVRRPFLPPFLLISAFVVRYSHGEFLRWGCVFDDAPHSLLDWRCGRVLRWESIWNSHLLSGLTSFVFVSLIDSLFSRLARIRP